MRLLETKKLSKDFGGLRAINELDSHINEGEILGLIGPNGAGKTTLFNLLTGIYPVTSGDILFKNNSIIGFRPYEIIRKGMARTFQKIRLFPRLTVLHNVILGGHCRTKTELWGALIRTRKSLTEAMASKVRAMELLEFVGLKDRMAEFARNLPYGQQKLLEIARAMATDPVLLLLDEPASGLNPQEGIAMINLIKSMRDRGITPLIIEHHMDVIMGISDRVIVINYGEKIFDGSPGAAQKDQKVVAAYLGK